MADDAPLPLAALWEARFGEPPPTGVDAAVPAGLARILGHRTIRRYTDQAVPEGLLSVLLACAQSAPSKSDLQQSSILVVKDPAIRSTIAGWLPDQPWVGQAPVFLVFLADLRRAQRLGELRGKANDNDNLDAFLNASVDAGLALQSFILAAEAAGLGCCPISMIRDHIEKATPLLGLPPRVFPIAGLCVGWPAVAGHVSMRLPPSVAVHVDRYDDTALPGLVDAYDQRREARAPTAPDKQKMTARYGVAPFYGWSENAARQLSAPERAGFKAFLQRHGFGLA